MLSNDSHPPTHPFSSPSGRYPDALGPGAVDKKPRDRGMARRIEAEPVAPLLTSPPPFDIWVDVYMRVRAPRCIGKNSSKNYRGTAPRFRFVPSRPRLLLTPLFGSIIPPFYRRNF